MLQEMTRTADDDRINNILSFIVFDVVLRAVERV
jgi:hypothetical protein